MDQANLLNAIAVGSLAFFALCLALLLAVAFPLMAQITRTLNAYENLAQTLDSELGPTLQEVQKVVTGVGELKQIAQQRVVQVGTKVEDVAGSLTKAAGSAQKHSSVMGAGIWAGLRAYLEGKSERNEKREHGKGEEPSGSAKQITIDRGEENVGLKR